MVSGEKRTIHHENFMEKITNILLDIEGTTTSVSFVKDTLFSYVKDHLQSYVDSNWDNAEFKEDVAALKEQAKKDEEEKIEGFCPIEEGEKEKESVVKNVLWQISLDRKTTALKQLQGHIWREAYKNGKIKGHVYSDVVPALKKWCEENRRVFIFSSGSVEAQKLLFGHTEQGDLLEYISGHFDTTIGPKNESESYTNIIKSMECEKDQVLFLTDAVKEAEAAQDAGMKVVLVIRENSMPLTDGDQGEFLTISSFNELSCENSAKRKKLSDEEVVEKKPEKELERAEAEKELHANGTEKMEVEESNIETKTESAEKTGNKTEEVTKTESEECEIDVVNEEKKEREQEEEETCKANGGEEDEEETSCKANGEEDTTGQKEPQIDISDSTPASDPLDLSDEKQKEEEDDNERQSQNEFKNGNDDMEKLEDVKPNGETEKQEEKVEGMEINGDADHEEEKENGVEESIPVSKVIPEDKPEPTVEVNA